MQFLTTAARLNAGYFVDCGTQPFAMISENGFCSQSIDFSD